MTWLEWLAQHFFEHALALAWFREARAARARDFELAEEYADRAEAIFARLERETR